MSSFGDHPDLSVHWKSSEDMEEVRGESVQSVITSPPYWNLKDYGHENQIGIQDSSYEEYLDRIQTVLSECYDALGESGTCWLVADRFIEKGDTKLLPYHLAERAKDLGFLLQDIITWYKPTAIAGINDRSVVNKKEYIVFLSKSEDYYLAPEIEENATVVDTAVDESSDILGNVWRHPVKRGSLAKSDILHKAPYPVSLAERLVGVSTEQSDTVLDPFLGSGTTAYAALEQGRKCVGYELNAEFEEVIEERLSELNQTALTADFNA